MKLGGNRLKRSLNLKMRIPVMGAPKNAPLQR
jgi:hypothetical protein